jgi:CheY-like chemotaxis protein
MSTVELSKLLRGRQALVIDDERFSRSIICRFLLEMGLLEADQAKDGAEGLTRLATEGNGSSLVICDFNMPVMNGLQFLKALRSGIQRSVRRDLPVIMLTGHSDHGLVGTAMALDVDAFLVKPVSKANLAGRLGHALSTTQDIKDSSAYAAVDVDKIAKRILSGAPVGKTKAASEPDVAKRGQRIEVALLQPHSVLSEDLVAPTGELLLAAGVTLSPRMVQRLRELPSLGINISAVWIL